MPPAPPSSRARPSACIPRRIWSWSQSARFWSNMRIGSPTASIRAVVREAYSDNPAHRAATVEALAKVRNLCCELGIVTPGSRRLWRAFGIWETSATVAPG